LYFSNPGYGTIGFLISAGVSHVVSFDEASKAGFSYPESEFLYGVYISQQRDPLQLLGGHAMSGCTASEASE
jgi:hypothetical protein